MIGQSTVRLIKYCAALAAALCMMTTVAACGSGSGGYTPGSTIKVGTVPALYWAAWSATPDTMKQQGSDVHVELVPFKSSADAAIALQTGDIQMAALGTDVASTGLAAHNVPVSM